jgi:Zn2+/Cd2+-exporting ATPase
MSDVRGRSPQAVSCEWTVSGMDCGSCAAKVRGAVERLPGVSAVEVLPMRERLRLTLDSTRISRERVEAAVKALGYGVAAPDAARRPFVIPGTTNGAVAGGASAAAPGTQAALVAGSRAGPAASVVLDPGDREAGDAHADPADRGKSWHQSGKGRLVILTGLLLVLAWSVELATSQDVGRWAFIAACLVGVAPVARRAFAAVRAGMPFTIEMLMTIAAVGALLIGAAEEAALVVFLFAVGEVLEGVAADRARASIRALANLVPKSALLEQNGTTHEVPAATLAIGQVILARPGDRIAADGEVVEGTSGVDQSPVTGESVPVTRGPGDPVFAGSINAEAALPRHPRLRSPRRQVNHETSDQAR